MIAMIESLINRLPENVRVPNDTGDDIFSGNEGPAMAKRDYDLTGPDGVRAVTAQRACAGREPNGYRRWHRSPHAGTHNADGT